MAGEEDTPLAPARRLVVRVCVKQEWVSVTMLSIVMVVTRPTVAIVGPHVEGVAAASRLELRMSWLAVWLLVYFLQGTLICRHIEQERGVECLRVCS